MKKGITYILLFIVLVVIDILAFTIFKDTTFENKIAFINIAYISLVYFVDKIVESFDKKDDNKKYWFKNFILEKYIYDYCDFFESGISMLREANSESIRLIENNVATKDLINETEKLCKDFFEKFSIKKRKITSINTFVQIYDNELYLKVQKIIENFQNEYTKMLEGQLVTVKDINLDKNINDIYKFQNELLKEFYNHSINKKIKKNKYFSRKQNNK